MAMKLVTFMRLFLEVCVEVIAGDLYLGRTILLRILSLLTPQKEIIKLRLPSFN